MNIPHGQICWSKEWARKTPMTQDSAQGFEYGNRQKVL